MPKEVKKETSELVVENKNSTTSKTQVLRVSTIVKNSKIDSVTSAAVMTAYRLKPGSRIEPAKFLKMVESFGKRKIKKSRGAR